MSRIEEMKKNAASRVSNANAPKILKGMAINAMPLLSKYSRYDVYNAVYADARDEGLSAIDIFEASKELLQPDIFIACDVGNENVEAFRRMIKNIKRNAEYEMSKDLDHNVSILCDAAAEVLAENRKK
jgi:methylase of polypeptide subunit release factors